MEAMNYDIKQLVIDHNPNHETLIYILPSSDKAQKLSLEELARYFKNESRCSTVERMKIPIVSVF